MIKNYVPQAYPLWATAEGYLGPLLVVGWTAHLAGEFDNGLAPVVVFEGAGSSTTAGPFVLEGPASFTTDRPQQSMLRADDPFDAHAALRSRQ